MVLEYVIFIIIILLILSFLKNKHYDIDNTYANDVTKMNKTIVDNIFYVKSITDVINVIEMAKKNNKKVIARGEQHSMGGQSIAENGYIIDTKYLNHVLMFDKENKTVTVEPGITWANLIYFLNFYSLSPIILQSYASFSVGGSVCVNIHGITSDNVLCNSIEEIEIVNSDAKIILCNRKQNVELFTLIIGGYGLFGIITKIKLKVTNNKELNMESINTNIYNFNNVYQQYINNHNADIKIARINIINMEDINLYVFTDNKKQKVISNIDNMPKEMSKISQLVYKWILPNRKIQKIRFSMENIKGKPLDFANNNLITRNEFLYESAKPISTLYSPLIDIKKTHILQEYFIPNNNNNFITWMKILKQIFVNNIYKNITLLNITIRYVLHDKETFLNYAKQDMYAFVFYYRINCNDEADNELQIIHNLLVNITLQLGGTFYLPYRLHYTDSQLKTSYPNINEFFKFKKKYDPNEMFQNLWYDKYKNI